MKLINHLSNKKTLLALLAVLFLQDDVLPSNSRDCCLFDFAQIEESNIDFNSGKNILTFTSSHPWIWATDKRDNLCSFIL